jgi:hypothetical protein
VNLGEKGRSIGRADVNGKTVTLLRRSLNSVPEMTKAGRVLRISVPTDGSNLAIGMLPSR